MTEFNVMKIVTLICIVGIIYFSGISVISAIDDDEYALLDDTQDIQTTVTDGEPSFVTGEVEVLLTGPETIHITDVNCEYNRCVLIYMREKQDVKNLLVKLKPTPTRDYDPSALPIEEMKQTANRMTITSDGEKMYAVRNTIRSYTNKPRIAIKSLTHQPDIEIEEEKEMIMMMDDHDEINDDYTACKNGRVIVEWVCIQSVMATSVCMMISVVFFRFLFEKCCVNLNVLRRIFNRRSVADINPVVYV